MDPLHLGLATTAGRPARIKKKEGNKMVSAKKMSGIKRVSDVTKPVIQPGPYGEAVNVYSLPRTEYLFQFDFLAKEFKTLEGDNGEYMHILGQLGTFKDGEFSPITGPEGETGDIAVSTGARSIVGKMEQLADDGNFPAVGRFTQGKGRGSNVWYDFV